MQLANGLVAPHSPADCIDLDSREDLRKHRSAARPSGLAVMAVLGLQGIHTQAQAPTHSLVKGEGCLVDLGVVDHALDPLIERANKTGLHGSVHARE